MIILSLSPFPSFGASFLIVAVFWASSIGVPFIETTFANTFVFWPTFTATSGNSIKRDTVIVPLTETGCYVFEIFDSYGDGGTTYKIYDGSETRL